MRKLENTWTCNFRLRKVVKIYNQHDFWQVQTLIIWKFCPSFLIKIRLEGSTIKSVIFFTVLSGNLKNHENTVLGYKKGSKLNSDKWSMSATQTLWVVSFVTFVIRWAEHTSRGGGAKWGVLAPPQARKVSIWRTMSQHESLKTIYT